MKNETTTQPPSLQFANCELHAIEVKPNHIYLIKNVDHSPEEARRALVDGLQGFRELNALFICVDGDSSIEDLTDAQMNQYGWYRQTPAAGN